MYCKYCGGEIHSDSIVCTHCGRQVQDFKSAGGSNVVINNVNTNSNLNANSSKVTKGNFKNKWVALFLCIFLGFFGAHKFYEEKFFMGIVYLITCGIFGFGVFFDFFALLLKPTKYCV
ncbi:MAG: TM2 domain-containing protein [Clostridia bacterium]|nr:TM2 domain-containing protein [Clostridia bacterium]